MKTKEISEALIRETEKIIIGKQDTVRLVLAAIFCGGHVLLEDLPGSGKTTLVRTLAIALGCDFKRLQFTPDLLPSDVVGMTVFNQKTGDFQVKDGPVQTNLLLADEINRAIPRTQSALLEAMEERQVTIDGVSRKLPEPFFVMATQNPVEKESTFPLPAAQLDRFFLKLSMGYPSPEEEVAMLTGLGDETPYSAVRAAASPAVLASLREEITAVTLSDEVKQYIVELVQRTRKHPSLQLGASPRGSRTLYQGSKALAAMAGRSYALPEDVQQLFLPAVSHRVSLTGEARYSGKQAEDILREILTETEVPPYRKDRFRHE